MAKMNPVVHFEMPYENAKRASDFYAGVFGWQTKMQGEQYGNYIVVTTTETDAKTGRPKNPGTINGGLYPRMKDSPVQCPSVVIGVDDLQASMKLVVKAGGKIIGEPVDIPGIGLYASFYDTEGNRVTLLQPKGM